MSIENNQSPNNSRLLAGVFIIIIGIVFLFRQMGFSVFPYWVFTWPMILIAVGIYIGIKHNFRGGGWLVMLIIGGFFLVDDILDIYDMRRYLVPAILIGVGAMLILRPKKENSFKFDKGRWRNGGLNSDTSYQTNTQSSFTNTAETTPTDEERINTSAIFGSVEKIVVSKNFKGGQVVSVFGGSEIDLSQADINGTASLEVTAVMGGVKLVVPPHWTLKQGVAAIFGGVEDKRNTYNTEPSNNKILILKGTAFMGGIEIVSYR